MFCCLGDLKYNFIIVCFYYRDKKYEEKRGLMNKINKEEEDED